MTVPPDTPSTVLDHIDNIVVPGDVFAEAANEYWAMLFLWDGMSFLDWQARRFDEQARCLVNPAGTTRFSGSLSCEVFDSLPRTLITCGFHWYAVSACQYVKTVGTIAHRHNPTLPTADQYVTRLIPDVKAFRDKVAAHFAWCTRNSHDNDAERDASILPSITFNVDSFYTNDMTLTLRKKDRVTTSEKLAPWSIAKIHELLHQRYWPHSPVQPVSRR